MPASSGRDLVIKDASSSPAVAVAGARTKGVNINAEPVDVTDDDSSGWRELLDEPGQKPVDISLSVVTDDETWRAKMMTAISSQAHEDIEVTYPDGATLTGTFFIASYKETGEYNGADTFEMELQSSGTITYTAAP